MRGDFFSSLSKAFIDGVEVRVKGIPKLRATETKWLLKNDLEAEIPELIFKNLLFTQRKDTTYIWITLSPETAVLTPRISHQLSKVRS
jgi:hypothetical protein